jgi:hypothetical protein
MNSIELYSARQVAAKIGKTKHWINLLRYELSEKGHAKKVDGRFIYFKSAIDYMRNRPDGRGRPKKGAKYE